MGVGMQLHPLFLGQVLPARQLKGVDVLGHDHQRIVKAVHLAKPAHLQPAADLHPVKHLHHALLVPLRILEAVPPEAIGAGAQEHFA